MSAEAKPKLAKTTSTPRMAKKSAAQPQGDAPSAVPATDGYAFDEEPPQFGGAAGVLLIILFSHFLLYYLYISLRLHNGALFVPVDWRAYAALLWEEAFPTFETWAVYLTFIVFQTALGFCLPGLSIQGLPVKSLAGKKLTYNCNGYGAWCCTEAVVALLHFSGLFRVQWIAEHYGALMTTMVIFGDLVALTVYACGFLPRVPGEGHPGAFRKERMTGNHVYDFFMGASLNPRLAGPFPGGLDIKMWAEVRVSWITLFLITCSAAAQQYATVGHITAPMALMVLAHWLYTNACVKGEECIVPTWDIAHEKWGWMLCFWNLAGVPIMYTWNSMYLLSHPERDMGVFQTVVYFALYLLAYYIWDTSNSQKNHFRSVLAGTYKPRPWYVFPQLPWKVVDKPDYITTKAGTPLLTDGWFKYARKLNYTMDIYFALAWGLACGPTHFLPFFYFCFFTSFILHRAFRDDERCRAKYGEDWERYKKKVKYLLVPFVF